VLEPDELEHPGLALARLHERLRKLADQRRFEDAARLRDRIAAVEDVARQLLRLERLRALERCLLVPALEPGWRRAVFVAGGRVAAVRSLPPGAGAAVEVGSGLAAAAAARAEGPCLDPEAADELLVVATFLRRPPPELIVAPLDAGAILSAHAQRARAA
jgi:DNA polymerase-3 subunit epsilon